MNPDWREAKEKLNKRLKFWYSPQDGRRIVFIEPKKGSRADADSSIKFFLDAMEEAVYHKDSQVDAIVVFRASMGRPDEWEISEGEMDAFLERDLRAIKKRIMKGPRKKA